MPKRLTPEGVTIAASKTTWPKPPTRVVRDGDAHKTAYKVFEYWASLPENCSQNAELRVYRTWPVTDSRLAAREHKHELILRGPITFQWENWREEFLHQLGSGGYHVYLNEVGVPGSIMESYFTLSDWEHYPPKVDLNTLIQGEPKNQDYIEWLKRQGKKLPWEDDESEREDEEEEEMKAVTELVDKVLVSAEKRAEEAEKRADAAQSRPAENTAETEGIKLVAHASHVALDTMAKYVGPQQDPMANLEKLGAFMDRNNGNSETLAFVKIMMESQSASQERERANQREHFEFMKTILIEKARLDVPAAPPVAPKSFIEQAKEFKEFKDVMLDVVGKSPRRESDGGGFWENASKFVGEHPEMLATAGTALGGAVTAIVGLFKPAATPPAASGSPADALTKAGGNGGAPPNAGRVAGPAAPNPEDEQRVQRENLIRKIGRPLLIHLSDPSKSGLDGRSWAEYILTDGVPEGGVTPEGRGFYEQLKKMGERGMISIISSVPAYFESIKLSGDRFPKFWLEFENYDKWVEEQQKKEG